MYTLILCLFIACLFPYLSKIPVVVAMRKEPGGHDNNHPRIQQATLSGFGARAVAAHQNSFESLIIFSAAILTALVTHNITHTIQGLAIFYLLSRCVYHLLYLLNWATLRTTVWALGLIASLSIIWLCLP
ncbi:MAPEG family protein [Legionella brunensis]|uniref:Transmembrane protein n=1 Tax=Legionella brunensis TaxID=29422 RepID=A0A0W0SPA3_9GAMM|nr:MAPEG family protein [Legionella brunensis]KTC85218.1 transmembrane protein [Legionella brunensis]